MAGFAPHRENQHMQATIDEAERDLTKLAIVTPAVDREERGVKLEIARAIQRDAVFGNVLEVLPWIAAESLWADHRGHNSDPAVGMQRFIGCTIKVSFREAAR